MTNNFINILTSYHGVDDIGITFIGDSAASDTFYPYGQLAHDIPPIAGALSKAGISQGDWVLFQLTDSREIIQCFWACAYLGAVPVMLPPALTQADTERINHVSDVTNKAPVLVDERTKPIVTAALDGVDIYAVNDLLAHPDLDNAPTEPAAVAGDDIRLIQFSSGSTGNPKGILVTENELLSSLKATIPRRPYTVRNSMLTWLPLTHNLSLVGFHIYSMFQSFNQSLMPTSAFITNPVSWLNAVTRLQPSVTVCPNFGFQHVLNYFKIRPLPEDNDIDLSSVKKLATGSEPIDAPLARKFTDALIPLGLHPQAICPVYGMSEACLTISSADVYEGIKTIVLDRSAITIGQHLSDITDPHGAEFVCLGREVPGVNITIRDDNAEILGADTVGEIYISGAPLTKAAITDNGVTPHKFTTDNAFGTGDIGVLHDDELYIIGRKKDIIFINGKNYYSPDLEGLLSHELGIETAVIGRSNPNSGNEDVIVFPVRPDHVTPVEQEKLEKSITSTLMKSMGVPTTQIIWIDTMPVAHNGKKLRTKLEKYL